MQREPWWLEWAERRIFPDWLIRCGIYLLVGIAARHADKIRAHRPNETEHFFQSMLEKTEGSAATHDAQKANEQHYEFPAEYYQQVLGSHLKYSCCLWDEQATTLDQAEERMLRATWEQAQCYAPDVRLILDFGCGWGSFTLYALEHNPTAHVVAFSNSASQKVHIRARAEALDRAQPSLRASDRLSFATADVGTPAFTDAITAAIPENLGKTTFDRIVSVEMLEHVKNHRAVFDRLSPLMHRDTLLFVHVFSSPDVPFEYLDTGSTAWMARNFFTGGIMPSDTLLPLAAKGLFEEKERTIISGEHYSKTARAWLERQDAWERNAPEQLRAVVAASGTPDTTRMIQKWRMFYLAVEIFFGFRNGNEWHVVHHLFKKLPTT